MSVGIDVSKETFQACLMMRYSDGRVSVLSNKSFDNGQGGFSALLSWVKRLTPKGYVGIQTVYLMEATGVYYEGLSYFLSDKSLDISVQLASNVKNFSKSLNTKTKTDRTDAEVIALMGIERTLSVWTAPRPVYRQLKQLSRERLALVEQKVRVKNQKHALGASHEPCEEALERIDAHIVFLEGQIKSVEKQIKKVVDSDETLQKKVKNVCTIKGVDITTAVTVIAECNGFELFKNKAQLVSFAGYDVVKNESGKVVDKQGHISKKGNKFIRRALHYPALTAIQHDPHFKQLAQRITDKTTIKMKGVVACQRKLLVLIYKLFINDTTYDPNYQEKNVKELKKGTLQSTCAEPLFSQAA